MSGYGEEAMQTCPSASALGHANYVGPKWETGEQSRKGFDDEGIQETLLAFLGGVEPNQEKMMQAREKLARTRPAYDLLAYEGGPSGYALPVPGQGSSGEVEVGERYGKSLAMGVATLDAWMRSYRQGWTDQCFLAYGQGTHWNSHTPMWDGFRPSASWQAMTLRNRYARGDLMDVIERRVPTLRRQGRTYPLIGSYAMRDGDRWSIFVVSRKLNESTPVTLRLPFQSARAIALHTQAGDPRENNRRAMNIQRKSRELSSNALQAGTFEIAGMPAGSIHLYVFEEVR